MPKQLNVNLAFTADTGKAAASIKSLQQQLTQLMNTGALNSNSLGLTKEIKDATTAVAQLKSQLSSATNSAGNLDLTKFNDSLKASGMTLESYRAKLSALGSDGTAAFSQLASSIASAEIPIRRANGLLQEMGTTLANTVRWQLSSSLLHGFMGTIQSAFGYAQDLNESLNKIQIVTQHSSDYMAEFAERANKAAQALNTTTTKYTDASLIYYQQGLNDSEVEKRTAVTIKMANAAGEAAQTVSQELTSVWNNFYDGSKSLEYYADVMTKLGAETASSSAEIANGLQKFAAIGDTVGLSYEYAASALATITATTRESADTVGNALKTLFARIQGLKLGETLEDGVDLNKYSQALESVGVHILEANGELKDMDSILDELMERWGQLSDAQQTALAQTVAGQRQYAQFMTLMNNADFFQENVGRARSSEGSLQEQADIYAQSWEAARDRVKVAAEGIYQSLIDDKFFIGVDDLISGILNSINGLIKGLGGIPGVLTTIGALLTKVFSAGIASNIDRIVNNITGASVKGARKLQEESIATLEKQAQNANLQGSQQGRAQAVGLQGQADLQRTLLENQSRLNEEQIKTAQHILDQNASLREQASEAGKIADIEKARAESQKQRVLTKVNNAIAANSLNEEDQISKKINVEQEIDSFQILTEKGQELTDTFAILKGVMASRDEDPLKIEILKQQFKEIAPDLDKMITDLEALDNKELSGALKTSLEEIKQSIANFDGSDTSIKKVEASLDDFLNKVVSAGSGGEESLKKLFKECGVEAEDAKKFVEELTSSFERNGEVSADLKAKMLALVSGIESGKDAIKGMETASLSLGQILSGLSSMAMSLASVIRTLSTFFDTLNDSEKTTQEKFSALLNMIPALLMSLSMLTNSLTSVAGKGIIQGLAKITPSFLTAGASAEVAAGGVTTFGSTLLTIMPWVAGVALALWGLSKVFKFLEEQSITYQLKQAEQAVDDAKTAMEEAKTAAEGLKSAFDEYDKVRASLDDCTVGTEEWYTALQNVNDQVTDMLEKYPELAGYLTSENGVLGISDEGKEVVQQKLQQNQVAAMGNYLAQTEKRNTLQVEAKSEEFYNSDFVKGVESVITGLYDSESELKDTIKAAESELKELKLPDDADYYNKIASQVYEDSYKDARYDSYNDLQNAMQGGDLNAEYIYNNMVPAIAEAVSTGIAEMNSSESAKQQGIIDDSKAQLESIYDQVNDINGMSGNVTPGLLSEILSVYSKTQSTEANNYKSIIEDYLLDLRGANSKDELSDSEKGAFETELNSWLDSFDALFANSDFITSINDYSATVNAASTEMQALAESTAAATLQMDEEFSKRDDAEEYYSAAGNLLLSLQKQYAEEAAGMSESDLIKHYQIYNANGLAVDNNGKYTDENGNSQELSLDELIGFYSADMAAKSLADEMDGLIATTSKLEATEDERDQTLAKVIKGEELGNKDLDNFKSEDDIRNYLDSKSEDLESVGLTVDKALQMMLDSLRGAEVASKKISEASDSFIQGFLDQVMEGEGWKNSDLPVQKLIGNILENAAQNGDYEGLSLITDALTNVKAEAFDPLAELLSDSSIDWSTLTEADLTSQLGDIVDVFGEGSEIDYSNIINFMKDLTSVGESSLSERFGEVSEIISKIKDGSTISVEDYEKLGSDITDGFFLPMADGTYKLTQDAESFYNYVTGKTIEDFKGKLDDNSANISNIHDLQSKYSGGQELYDKISPQSAGFISEHGLSKSMKDAYDYLDLLGLIDQETKNAFEQVEAGGEMNSEIWQKFLETLNANVNSFDLLTEKESEFKAQSEDDISKLLSLMPNMQKLGQVFDEDFIEKNQEFIDSLLGLEGANLDNIIDFWQKVFGKDTVSGITNLKEYKEAMQGIGDRAGLTAAQSQEALANIQDSIVADTDSLAELYANMDYLDAEHYSQILEKIFNEQGTGTLEQLREIDKALQEGKADAELMGSILDRIMGASDLTELEKAENIRKENQKTHKETRIDEYTGQATEVDVQNVSDKDAGMGLIELAKSDNLLDSSQLSLYEEGLSKIGDKSKLTAMEVRNIGQAATEVAKSMTTWTSDDKINFIKDAFGGDNIDPANMRLYADAVKDLFLAENQGDVDKTLENLEEKLINAGVPAEYLKEEIKDLLNTDGYTTSQAISTLINMLESGTLKGQAFLDVLKGVMENASPQQQMDILQNNQEDIEKAHRQTYANSGMGQAAIEESAHNDYLKDAQNVIDSLDASSFETPEAFVEFFDMLPEGVNYMGQLTELFGSIAEKVTSFDQLDKLGELMANNGASDKDFSNPENTGWQTAMDNARTAEAGEIGVDVDEFKNYEDAIYETLSAQNELINSSEGVKRSQEELQILSMKMTKSMMDQEEGFKNLGDVLKKYSGDLNNIDDTSVDSVAALTKIQEACNQLFGGKVSKNFVKDNLEDIKKAAGDDQDALKRLQKEAAKDYASGLKEAKKAAASTTDELRNTVKAYDKLGKSMEEAFDDMENAEIGDDISENFRNTLNEMLASGEMTADEIEQTLNHMGYDANMDGMTMAASTAQEIAGQMTDGMGQVLEYGTQEFGQAMAGLSGEARGQLQELVSMYQDAGMSAGEAYTAAINNIDTQLAVSEENVSAGENADASSTSNFTMHGSVNVAGEDQEFSAQAELTTTSNGAGDADITLPVLGKGGAAYNGGGAGAGARTGGGGGSGGGRGGCFIAGTLITTINGYKNIEDIQIGDIVLSYNEQKQKNEYSTVLDTMIHIVYDNIYTLYINNEQLNVTGIHRFLIKRNNQQQWIQASELKANDLVLFADGSWHIIEKIDIKVELKAVYNFEVDCNHNYYVGYNQILAHNKGRGGRGGGRAARRTTQRAVSVDRKDSTERYHYLEKALENLNKQYEQVNKVKDIAFGKNHLQAINNEIALHDSLISKQKEYRAEVEKNLKLDKAALTNTSDNLSQEAQTKYKITTSTVIGNKLSNKEKKKLEKLSNKSKLSKKQQKTLDKLTKKAGDLKEEEKFVSDSISLGEYLSGQGSRANFINAGAENGAVFDKNDLVSNIADLKRAADSRYNENAKYYAANYKDVSYDGTNLAEVKKMEELSNWWAREQAAYEQAMKNIEQYEETLRLYWDKVAEEIDQQIEKIKSKVEKAVYIVDIKLELDDLSLEQINFQLERMGDHGRNAAAQISELGKVLTTNFDKMNLNEEAIANVFDTVATENFDEITDEAGQVWKFGGENSTYLKGKDIVSGLKSGDKKQTEDAIAELMKGYEAGTLTTEQIDQWKKRAEENLSLAQETRENYFQMFDYAKSGMDYWNQQMENIISQQEHLNGLIEHHRNVVDLVGRAQIAGSREAGRILEESLDKTSQAASNTRIKNYKAQYDSENTKLTSLENKVKSFRAAVETAEAEGGDKKRLYELQESLARYEELYNEQVDITRTAQNNMNAAFEEALQTNLDSWTRAMDRAVEEFQNTLTGTATSLDYLAAALQRFTDTHSTQVAEYEKVHQLRMLDLQAQKAIDEATDPRIQRELLDIQNEINASTAKDVKMSQYQLDYLKQKLELKQAEAAFEDAQQAKTQVSLTRDNEGNFGYVYTADEGNVADAEKNYQDKIYEMQKANAEYIQDLQNQMVTAQQDYEAAMQEVANDTTLSEEDRHRKFEAIAADYDLLRQNLFEQLENALVVSHEVYGQYSERYAEVTGDLTALDIEYTGSFKETVLAQETGFTDLTTYTLNWAESSKKLMEDLETAWGNYTKSNETSFTAAGETFSTYGSEVDKTAKDLKGQMEALSSQITQTATDSEDAFDKIIKALTATETDWDAKISNMIETTGNFIEALKEAQLEMINLADIAEDGNVKGGAAGAGGLTAVPIPRGTRTSNVGGGPNKLTIKRRTYKRQIRKLRAVQVRNVRAYKNKVKELKSTRRYTRASAASRARMDKKIQKEALKAAKKALMRKFEKNSKLKSVVLSYDTGGYTGAWNNNDGRLAMLHQKELVLNKDDTQNMLSAVNVIRDLAQKIDLNALASAGAFSSGISGINGVSNGTLEQEVHITAEFPNATDRNEITEAFNNIIGLAAQYANK